MPRKAFRSSVFFFILSGGFAGLNYAWLIALDFVLPIVTGALSGAALGWGILATGLPVRKRSYRIPLLIITALLTFYLFIPIVSAYFSVHTIKHPVDLPATTLSPEAVEIDLASEDDIAISGWYQPSENDIVIVILHGLNSNRLQVLPQAKALVVDGFGVVMLDLRGHGNSGGTIFSPCLAKSDVTAALDFVQATEPDALIGILGIGLGAHTGICAAAENERVDALIVDGVTFGKVDDVLYPRANSFKIYNLLIPAYKTYITAMDLFSNTTEPTLQEMVMQIFPRPIMFIAAEKDILEPDQARRYMAFACSASMSWKVPGATRQKSFASNPDSYSEQMIVFISKQLQHTP